jgi:hypothetical protein
VYAHARMRVHCSRACVRAHAWRRRVAGGVELSPDPRRGVETVQVVEKAWYTHARAKTRARKKQAQRNTHLRHTLKDMHFAQQALLSLQLILHLSLTLLFSFIQSCLPDPPSIGPFLVSLFQSHSPTFPLLLSRLKHLSPPSPPWPIRISLPHSLSLWHT